MGSRIITNNIIADIPLCEYCDIHKILTLLINLTFHYDNLIVPKYVSDDLTLFSLTPSRNPLQPSSLTSTKLILIILYLAFWYILKEYQIVLISMRLISDYPGCLLNIPNSVNSSAIPLS